MTTATDGSVVNFCEGEAQEERREEGRANVDDSCTTDDQRKEPTYLQLRMSTSSNVLRDLHLCTSCENNALVLVDQVGL